MVLRPMAASAAILLLSSAAHAGLAEELTAAINKCAAITDDATRHACYDRLPTLLKPSGPIMSTETAPPVAAQPKAPPPSDERGSSPGGFDLLAGEAVPANHISAAVESFTFDYGVFVVTLDNGQVWRQVQGASELVHLSKEKKNQVAIWRSYFGYDVMKIEGFHTTYHVKRIR